jgi:hypothetical protein
MVGVATLSPPNQIQVFRGLNINSHGSRGGLLYESDRSIQHRIDRGHRDCLLEG